MLSQKAIARGALKRAIERAVNSRNSLGRNGRSAPELHDADDLLAEALARPADHDRVDDVRVAPQHLLDLLDEDLLAAAVDHQRVAPEEHDLSVGREPRAVARDGDALAVDEREGLLGLLRVAEIAERDVAAPRGPADLFVARREEAATIRRQHGGAGCRGEGARRPRAPVAP